MSKSKRVDRAIAVLHKPRGTDGQKISATRTTTEGMLKSSEWNAATDVQAAVKVWNAQADILEANGKAIATLRDQLRAAETKQLAARRDWAAATKQVLSTVTLHCEGSADLVKSFTLDIQARGTVGPLAAPTGLTVNPGTKPGEIVANWPRNEAKHGFLVQHATDPANASTVSAPKPHTATKFTLGGMPTRANVSVRVAAIDPASADGQSPWSEWVVGNAR